MEIELMRANARSEVVERKLKNKDDELDATRKELTSLKRQLEKLNRQPIIHSESLKVIMISSRNSWLHKFTIVFENKYALFYRIPQRMLSSNVS